MGADKNIEVTKCDDCPFINREPGRWGIEDSCGMEYHLTGNTFYVENVGIIHHECPIKGKTIKIEVR